jgi:SMC interacting uncharacterized protein involved in chromosome segregation
MAIELLTNTPESWTLGTFIAVVFGFIGRYLLSKQGVALNSDSAHTTLIKNLKSERDEWKAHAIEREKEHDAQREEIALLKSQNAMLRMLLIQKGVTIEELTAIGAMA